MSLNTTPATWVAGSTVTAAQMNAEIRDALVGIQSAWTAYTPTPTNITLGNGTLVCAFTRWGKTIRARGKFSAGSTTTFAAGTLAFSLPVTPHAAYTGPTDGIGTAMIQPAAAGTRWAGIATINATGLLTFLAASGANAVVTNLIPGTFTASSAVITWDISYEAA